MIQPYVVCRKKWRGETEDRREGIQGAGPQISIWGAGSLKSPMVTTIILPRPAPPFRVVPPPSIN
jgi:hypothetical protein